MLRRRRRSHRARPPLFLLIVRGVVGVMRRSNVCVGWLACCLFCRLCRVVACLALRRRGAVVVCRDRGVARRRYGVPLPRRDTHLVSAPLRGGSLVARSSAWCVACIVCGCWGWAVYSWWRCCWCVYIRLSRCFRHHVVMPCDVVVCCPHVRCGTYGQVLFVSLVSLLTSCVVLVVCGRVLAHVVCVRLLLCAASRVSFVFSSLCRVAVPCVVCEIVSLASLPPCRGCAHRCHVHTSYVFSYGEGVVATRGLLRSMRASSSSWSMSLRLVRVVRRCLFPCGSPCRRWRPPRVFVWSACRGVLAPCPSRTRLLPPSCG